MCSTLESEERRLTHFWGSFPQEWREFPFLSVNRHATVICLAIVVDQWRVRSHRQQWRIVTVTSIASVTLHKRLLQRKWAFMAGWPILGLKPRSINYGHDDCSCQLAHASHHGRIMGFQILWRQSQPRYCRSINLPQARGCSNIVSKGNHWWHFLGFHRRHQFIYIL